MWVGPYALRTRMDMSGVEPQLAERSRLPHPKDPSELSHVTLTPRGKANSWSTDYGKWMH